MEPASGSADSGNKVFIERGTELKMVNLGVMAMDKITGFKGRVTGFVVYISGCNQALLTPSVGKDGKMVESMWVDEQRLEITDAKVLILDNSKTPGADLPAPKR